MKRLFRLALVMVFVLGGIATVSAFEQISARDAYIMLENENTYILDVRTPCEWRWVGHPGKDKCGDGEFLEGKVIHIPWKLWFFDPDAKKYVEELNKFFDEEVVRQFNPDDTLIIMCRSGNRSEDASDELEKSDSVRAAKRLEELDFYNIFNMTHGFEGGKDKCDYRTLKEGWKNKGLPYNYSYEGIWTLQQTGRSLAE